MSGIIVFFLNNNKLSSNVAQISEHIKCSNQKIYYYDQTSKIIVNSGSKNCEINNNQTCQINHIQKPLLMSMVDTPEKYLSNVDGKSDMIKVSRSSIKSSSTLFYCSIHAMYKYRNMYN